MSLSLLKKACEKYSQRQVAQKIDKSATTINLILKGKYPKPEKILQKVAEVFTDLDSNEVVCPILGTIHINVCSKYQSMAIQKKMHKDRLYMQVKEACLTCKGL